MEQKQAQESQASQQPAAEDGHHVNEGAREPARRGTSARQVYRCANCEIEFFWTPVIVQQHIYCCSGCAAGGPCTCDYSLYHSVTIMGVIHYE